MGAPGLGTITCRAALVAPLPLIRVMAYSLLYLVDLAGPVAAWVVAARDEEIDRAYPVVYWTGSGGGERYESPVNPGSDGLALASGAADPIVMLDESDPSGAAWQLPMSEEMGRQGYVNRMLLIGRHEDETVGLLGFLKRHGDAGFTEETADLVRLYSSVVGHTFSTVRQTEHLLGARPTAPVATLSSRESEVAVLAARGASNTEIGSTLGISTGTVKAHLHRVFEKLGVDTRTKLALLLSADRARRPDEALPGRDSP